MPRRRIIVLATAVTLHAVVLAAVSSLAWCLLMDPSEGWTAWAEEIVDPAGLAHDPVWWLVGMIPGVLIAVTQAIFLVPVVRHRLSLQREGRPMVPALLGVAFVAGVLSTAMLLAAVDLVGILTTGRGLELEEWVLALLTLVPLVCSWLIWTPLLVVFARRRPHQALPGRLVGLLLGGTIAEMVIIIPIDILVRQRTTCHCATPSFHATWLAVLALLWLSGPGLLIAILSRRRKPWLEKHCANCGYRKGERPGSNCPECGYAWLRTD